MKHKLNITTLAVAALLYCFGATAEVNEVVIDFDGVALSGTAPQLWASLATHSEDGYTMVVDSGSGGFLTNRFSTATYPFTGALVVPWQDDVGITFTNDGGGTFSAISAAVGCGIANAGPGQWTVTGYPASGGTIGPIYLNGVTEGVKTITNFPSTFTNLTKISFLSSGSGRAALDELTLGELVPLPNAGAVILQDGAVEISFDTSVGQVYDVVGRYDPVAGIWMAVTNAVEGTGGMVDVMDPVVPGRRLYRVKCDPNSVGDIYVAPNGVDTAAGTISAPIQSIAQAQTLVRAITAAETNRQTPIVVLLRGGTYTLSDGLVFDTLDSGSAAAPVVYRAYPGETPVISGGVELSGWTVNASGYWELTIPEVVSESWRFNQLWSDGERRYRACTTKNATEGDKFKYFKNVVDDLEFEFYPGDIDASWTDLDSVELKIFHKWDMSSMLISSIAGNSVTIVQPLGVQAPIAGFTRYIVENVFEALSEPGEWYLNHLSGLLTYIPVPGEDPETTIIVAPKVWRPLSIEGTGPNDKVEYITFDGITVSYNHRQTPSYGHRGSLAEQALTTCSIYMEYADNIKVKNCSINHTAGHGIIIDADCHSNTVESCVLSDLGGGGIHIGVETLITDPPEEVTSYNTIQDNLIVGGGRIYGGTVGVLIRSAAHNSVLHNDISDFYYTGIYVGATVSLAPNDCQHNEIGYNRIEKLGQRVLSDMGGVYLPGPVLGTRVHHNIIEDVSRADYGGWGLYNDQGSIGSAMDNNLVYDTQDPCYHMNRGASATISNNVFIASPDSIGVLARGYVPTYTNGTLSVDHNIMVLTYGRSHLFDGIFDGSTNVGNHAFDNNLYYAGGLTPTYGGYYPGYSLATWQGTYSQDVNSSVANPLFVDPDNNDYSLATNSPAFSLGITSVDLSTAGRISSPKASDIAVAARAYPAKFSSAPIIIEFDDMSNAVASTVGYSVPGAGSILVTDAEGALSSTKSMHFVDSTGTSPEWFMTPSAPPIGRRGAHTFEAGEFHLAFSVKWMSGASLNIELRDWQKDRPNYIEGPSVDIDSSGNVIVDSSTVTNIANDVWTRLDMTVILGDGAVGTFDLDVTPEGSATESFTGLSCNSAGFYRLNYIGILSTASTTQEFFIDEFYAGVE